MGKKSNLKRSNFLEYYAKSRLGLNEETIEKVVKEIESTVPHWHEMIKNSFLSEPMKEAYLNLLKKERNGWS